MINTAICMGHQGRGRSLKRRGGHKSDILEALTRILIEYQIWTSTSPMPWQFISNQNLEKSLQQMALALKDLSCFYSRDDIPAKQIVSIAMELHQQ